MPDPNATNLDTAQRADDADPAKDSHGAGGSDQTFTIKVDGTERTVTADEMRQLAEKSAGADKKFQEAAELRKQVGDAARLKELVERADNDDDEAFASAMRILGRPEDQIQEGIKFRQQVRAQRAAGSKGDDDDKETPPALTAQQQEDIKLGREAAVKQKKQEIQAEIEKTLDTDAVLGENMKSNQGIRPTVVSLAWKLVTAGVASGRQYGPELLGEVAQEIRAFVKSLAPAGGSGKPEADSLMAMLEKQGIGLGPHDKATLDAVKANKVPGRVSMTDPSYDENLAVRALTGGFAGKDV